MASICAVQTFLAEGSRASGYHYFLATCDRIQEDQPPRLIGGHSGADAFPSARRAEPTRE